MRISKTQTGQVGNVFSYLRWSSEPQTWGDSERRQEQAAKDWCARRGLQLADTKFVDRGVSAWKGKNQQGELGRLLSTVKAGDFLLVEDADRLSRQSWLSAMNFVQSVLAKGVTLVTLQNGSEITEASFQSNIGVFLPLLLRSHLANDESEKKSYRLRQSWNARKAAVRTGKPINQALPSSLRWDAEAKQLRVIEAKAEVVRRIFKLYLEGNSLKFVAHRLTQEGVPSISKKKNRGWGTSFVHQVLTNKSVIGFCRHVDPPQPDIYLAIVDKEDFYAAQAKLAERQRLTVPSKHVNTNLFTGLAKCSKCGGTLVMHSTRPNGVLYRYLVCGSALNGRTDCGVQTIRYQTFEQSILGLLAQEERVLAALTSGKPLPSNLDRLTAQLADLEKQAEKILRLIEADDEPPRSLVDRLKQIEAQESALREQAAAETAKAKASSPPAEVYRRWRSGCPVPIVKIDRGRVRELLRDLIDRIVIKLGENEFAVYFKGGHAPFAVKIFAANVKG